MGISFCLQSLMQTLCNSVIILHMWLTCDTRMLLSTRQTSRGGLLLTLWITIVDDINVIINATKAGLKFVESEGRVIQDDSVAEQERDIKADRRCMTLVQRIGNSIHPSVELEVDYPSRYEDSKLPILDLKA